MFSENFIDQVKIYCASGHGGTGAAHFRREKFIPKGGPDGGDGGDGGSLILQGSAQLWTLLHFKYNRHHKAKNGSPGRGNRMSGASGKALVLKVPLGTIAKDEQGNTIAEITQQGEQQVLFQGGKGGLGNWHFRNSVNRTPRYAQPGLPGREAWISLELKILADVGLVGFPNTGKSTLLSSLTAAKPKISDYAFTTLIPQLGIVQYRNQHSFVIADIPGIIQGASQGKGIGHRFLRHIERNAVLLFLIPCDTEDLLKEYEILLKELAAYKPKLLDKKRLLVVSKTDLLDEEMKKKLEGRFPEGLETIFISSHHQKGLEDLKDALWKCIHISLDL
ncbi:GTPase ObgE [Bacteroidetes bacterium endosymbiont of Geopemphigus sp.]|uniref:GTPase ObgE n=1 Tax=Bacteroidetes bacterium endosymbiont of Geopemphigus sp. TaxID=2047937 RepID=UPI000CCFD604|nr:GTPase ObgE [Bacteroidetes bacterium endosymbiont of Geopemphigus sp.]